MGHGITITCQFCSYSHEFTLGVGMEYSSLEKVIDIIPRSKRPDVQKIMDNHNIKQTQKAHELFQCQICNRLYDIFYVKIIYDNDQVYETDYRCYRCGGPLVLRNENDLSKLPCPRCGGEGLSASETMLWD
jgi:hypothetical protein